MHYNPNPESSRPQIIMFEIESSNIKAIGYDEETKTLRIKFKSANTYYDYKGISPELYAEFELSDSKGRFFFTQIKNKFQMEKFDK